MTVPSTSLIYAAFEEKATRQNRGIRKLGLYAYQWDEVAIDDVTEIDQMIRKLEQSGRFERHGNFLIDMAAVTRPHSGADTGLSFRSNDKVGGLEDLPPGIVASVFNSDFFSE